MIQIIITPTTEKADKVFSDHIKETTIRDRVNMRILGTRQEYKDKVLTITIDNVATKTMETFKQKKKLALLVYQNMINLEADFKKLGLLKTDYTMVLNE
jgi:hypothetical protein